MTKHDLFMGACTLGVLIAIAYALGGYLDMLEHTRQLIDATMTHAVAVTRVD